jgi:hypothetical protein
MAINNSPLPPEYDVNGGQGIVGNRKNNMPIRKEEQ